MKILYYNSSGRLYLEKACLLRFSKKVSTPFYIYSMNEIRKNCEEILKYARGYDFLPFYALKANYNPFLVKLIHQHGFGADVVSGGELYFARKCAIPAKKIVFAGVGKTRSELEQAIKSGIHSINIESEAELMLLDALTRQLKKKVNLAIRINPDIDPRTHPYISTGLQTNKFGITRDLAVKLYMRLKDHPYIKSNGIHVHIGSQITGADPYIQTVKFVLNLRTALLLQGVLIDFIDLGGGIGLHYQDQLDTAGVSRTYTRLIMPKVLSYFKNVPVKLMMELGRAVIGSAGLLLTRVLYVKKTPLKKFVIVDAGMNNLIRPSLYHAYHQILPLHHKDKKTEKVDVVGPVCESSDFFARDRKLESVQAGDYLAITGSGAYAQAISSNYNLRPSLAEYLVDRTCTEKIYKGESVKDIAAKYSWK